MLKGPRLLALTLISIFALGGCGQSSPEPTDASASSTPQEAVAATTIQPSANESIEKSNLKLVSEINDRATAEVCGEKLNTSGIDQFSELSALSLSGGLTSYCLGISDYAMEIEARHNGENYESIQKPPTVKFFAACDKISIEKANEIIGMGKVRMETCSKIDARVGRGAYCQSLVNYCGALITPVANRFIATGNEYKKAANERDYLAKPKQF